MNSPALTVAIPTYNGASHIEQALRSILEQTDVRFDLLISDDRSSDDTIQRIRNIVGDRAEVEVNTERLGLAGNWNRCVQRTRTPFLAIFHQDDVMLSGHLARHMKAFSEGVCLVASGTTTIDQYGQPVPASEVDPGGCGAIDRTFAPGEFLEQLAVANPLRCSAVTLRTEAIRQIHGFRPLYRYVVDWDAWIRLATACRVAWIAEPTVAMRWHVASETHSFKTGTTDLDESLRLLKDLDELAPELAKHRPEASRRISRAFLNRAYEAARSGQGSLVRESLARSIQLAPSTLGTIATDPRLLGRLLWGCFRKSPAAKR